MVKLVDPFPKPVSTVSQPVSEILKVWKPNPITLSIFNLEPLLKVNFYFIQPITLSMFLTEMFLLSTTSLKLKHNKSLLIQQSLELLPQLEMPKSSSLHIRPIKLKANLHSTSPSTKRMLLKSHLLKLKKFTMMLRTVFIELKLILTQPKTSSPLPKLHWSMPTPI